jgi:hypothetical protein
VRRRVDVAIAAAAVIVGGVFVAMWAQFLLANGTDNVGGDWETYRTAAERWLGGGSFYLERQLAGPYLIQDGDVLYPPPILVLLVPFTLVPDVAWWLVPLGLTAAIVVRHRPAPLGWLLIALCLLFPITGVKLLHGNPGMLFMAAVAGATILAWPAALVLLKPTLLPFALLGITTRRWWIAFAALVGVSLLFLPMWPDFVVAIRDGHSELGILYSLNEFPMIVIPVIAWVFGAASPLPASSWVRRTAAAT